MEKYGTGTRRNGNFYKAKISEYTKTNSQSELCEFPKINEFPVQTTGNPDLPVPATLEVSHY